MSRPIISIIIPVYNAEAYISRCIDSLLAQTFQDFEMILINDGSTDSSGTICDEYAQKESRIRVFHQSNSGVAAARQRGIDMAQGEFSIHADPDDWTEATILEELHAKAVESGADMTICDFIVDYADRSIVTTQDLGDGTPECCLEQLMYGKMHGSLCNKLIRSELLSAYNIRFIEGINHCEDFLICVQLFLRGIKVAYLPKALYHYDQTSNDHSLTRKYSKQTLGIRLRFIEVLKALLQRRSRALSHLTASVARECYYHRILSKREFAQTFKRYRIDFLRSAYKPKLRIKLFYKSSFAWLKRDRR